MSSWQIPDTYEGFRSSWRSNQNLYAGAYQRGETSFVPNLLPEQAVQLSTPEVLSILRGRLGDRLDAALQPERAISGPFQHHQSSDWLRRANTVGINVRTVACFWNVIKYVLTVPAIQDAIHLLPVWEPGVVGSLYGMSSWRINTEFFSPGLARACSWLDTVDKQLKITVNLLHALDRSVGMDVIPHVDRFSEISLAHPEYFEWLRRADLRIVDHRADLHEAVQAALFDFVCREGTADPNLNQPQGIQDVFGPEVSEALRLGMLFGDSGERSERLQRRVAIVRHLHALGFEPVPATMGPPYRGLEVDPRPQSKKRDEHGLEWRDFRITRPQAMSRAFGPLTRYKLYERLDDNRDWAIDFSRPRLPVWEYVCRHYAAVQREFGFDFMRGDMSHVQMRPTGVPADPDEYYDILGAVKKHIREVNQAAHFGYFAETFLAPAGTMAYGDEVAHLEAACADSTLGDLQSTRVGSAEFLTAFRYSRDLLETRAFSPNFTVITGDKDDPRFDEFYLDGNELRLFMAYFLTDMPSYMGMGFETRDRHPKPAPNEHYTKLYVFQESQGPKATRGAYVWGKNASLFHTVSRLRRYAERIWPSIQGRSLRWLLHANRQQGHQVLAWTQRVEPEYLFLANTSLSRPARDFTLPVLREAGRFTLRSDFSTSKSVPGADARLSPGNFSYYLTELAPGEGRVYRILPD